MKIDYDKVQARVKALGTVSDNDEFLEGFLSAFNFPSSTYNRLGADLQKGINKGVRIKAKGGLYFLASTALNLNSEFNILRKNQNLSTIKEAFIVIVNDNDVFAYERDSEEVLQSSKKDLYRYMEFFFSLLGIKNDSIPNEMMSPDKKAAEKFAELYNNLLIQNQDTDRDIAELLCRLLFCCFGDSIGVLTDGGLRHLIFDYTEESGSDMSEFFCNLFAAMKTESRDGFPGYFAKVRFIDSRLFENYMLPSLEFNREARRLILDLLALDWSEISPDILGALVQSIVRKKAGNSNGNYTSSANIHKVIDPLFMDRLYHEFGQIKDGFVGHEALLTRVKNISIFDPSSGTGNFLIVAYKELNKLAKIISESIEKLYESSYALSVADKSSYGLFVSWRNFHGIENDTFACAISRLGLLFAVCQEARLTTDVGRVFADAIDILFSDNIVEGNATMLDWEKVCLGDAETYLIGNPPYVGVNAQTDAQKADLKRVFAPYKDKGPNLDYAACWFMLATQYISVHGGGFAFVTTNSLTQDVQVPILWPKLFAKGVHIRFAYTPFKWRNDARNRTSVTVVMIGVVQNSNNQAIELITSTSVFELQSISPYLVPGSSIVSERGAPLSKLPEMLKGNMPYDNGNLLLNRDEMSVLLNIEPKSKKFVKKIVGAKEFLQGDERWCIWIEDADYDEAMGILEINKRVEKVRTSRLSNKRKSVQKLAERPHQFREMRKTDSQSLVVPAVSSENYLYIPVGFVTSSTIVTNLVSIIYNCEPWIFGVVASQMHNIWVKTVCGKHEMRPRYSLELGYNTFPFPDITEVQKDTILLCVRGIIEVRERFAPTTLAELYKPDQMPDDLRSAHSLLDKVVENCYRSAPFVSDQERLESLFGLYNKLRDADGKHH